MTRKLLTACAQMGPIAREETRAQCIARLSDMLREAHGRGCRFVVFPELALTTFFPRWLIDDPAELNGFYETEMPGPATRPLFDLAASLGVGFTLGYAELTPGGHRYNTSILVDPKGRIVGTYRKVHLPGWAEPLPNRAFQHLEKRYFEPGNLGFPVWRTMGGILGMAICNDRRWPETYRVLGLQGVEMVTLGYNTPFGHLNQQPMDSLTLFHNHLSMQAGAYQNATWVVGAAKCGTEEGSAMAGQSVIVAPSGEIVAQAVTVEDEVITASCDLDMGRIYKDTVFNFALHRRPEAYTLITERTGAIAPPEEP